MLCITCCVSQYFGLLIQWSVMGIEGHSLTKSNLLIPINFFILQSCTEDIAVNCHNHISPVNLVLMNNTTRKYILQGTTKDGKTMDLPCGKTDEELLSWNTMQYSRAIQNRFSQHFTKIHHLDTYCTWKDQNERSFSTWCRVIFIRTFFVPQ